MAFFKWAWHKVPPRLGSVAGPVIQATGRTDFEDGSRIATTLEVSNDLHSVRTSPEVNMAGPNLGRLDPGGGVDWVPVLRGGPMSNPAVFRATRGINMLLWLCC